MTRGQWGRPPGKSLGEPPSQPPGHCHPDPSPASKGRASVLRDRQHLPPGRANPDASFFWARKGNAAIPAPAAGFGVLPRDLESPPSSRDRTPKPSRKSPAGRCPPVKKLTPAVNKPQPLSPQRLLSFPHAPSCSHLRASACCQKG